MTLCGRQRDIQGIVDDCKSDHLVVLSHEPGMGASSLLKYGLPPAFAAEGAITLVWSDWQGNSFIADLKEAIAEAVRQQADRNFFAETERLDEILRRAHKKTGRPLLLLLDEFEDYLRCHSGSHLSDSFDAELSSAVAGHYAWFVVAIQSHAIGPFERLSQYVPNLMGFHRKLPPLTGEAAREAVLAEASRRSMDVETAVAEALVSCKTVACEGGIHPFFLMRGVTRILDAESRLKSTVARLSTFQLNGGPDRLVLESLDDTLSDLSSTSAELLFHWCKILISPQKNRASLTEKALSDYAGRLNRFVLTTLPQLREIGLLRSVQILDVTRYEISRECLTPILHDWWTRREAALLARRRAQFRVRSISVAAGAIVTMYITWLLFGK